MTLLWIADAFPNSILGCSWLTKKEKNTRNLKSNVQCDKKILVGKTEPFSIIIVGGGGEEKKKRLVANCENVKLEE